MKIYILSEKNVITFDPPLSNGDKVGVIGYIKGNKKLDGDLKYVDKYGEKQLLHVSDAEGQVLSALTLSNVVTLSFGQTVNEASFRFALHTDNTLNNEIDEDPYLVFGFYVIGKDELKNEAQATELFSTLFPSIKSLLGFSDSTKQKTLPYVLLEITFHNLD